MRDINIKEIIKARQSKNKDLHLKRVAELENISPEYMELNAKRNRLLGEASLLILSQQYEEAKQKQLAAYELDDREKEILSLYNLPDDYLDEIIDCPICHDQGFLADGEVCDCIKKILHQYEYSKYDLSEKLKDSNFKNFNLNVYSLETDPETGLCPREIMLSRLERAIDFCENFKQDPTSLYIYGKVGIGKTFYVSCIVNELIQNDVDVIYISASNLLNYLYKDVSNHQNLEGSFKEEFKNVELLVIDDLGTESMNDFSLSSLSEIIDYRILNHKSTIITSNLDPTSILRENLYPERMVSRIIGSYDLLPFIGSDLRIELIKSRL